MGEMHRCTSRVASSMEFLRLGGFIRLSLVGLEFSVIVTYM